MYRETEKKKTCVTYFIWLWIWNRTHHILEVCLYLWLRVAVQLEFSKWLTNLIRASLLFTFQIENQLLAYQTNLFSQRQLTNTHFIDTEMQVCWLGFKVVLLPSWNCTLWLYLHRLLLNSSKEIMMGNYSKSDCLSVASLAAQTEKHLPAVRETWVWSLGWEDPLEKEMATHSSTLA